MQCGRCGGSLMHAALTFCAELAPASEAIAIHLLHASASAQPEGRRIGLAELTAALGARRGGVRRILSALHRAGFVDVLLMALTMRGFAIGVALEGRPLVPLRRSRPAKAA